LIPKHGDGVAVGLSTLGVQEAETRSKAVLAYVIEADGDRIGFDKSYVDQAANGPAAELALQVTDRYRPARMDYGDRMALVMPLRLP